MSQTMMLSLQYPLSQFALATRLAVRLDAGGSTCSQHKSTSGFEKSTAAIRTQKTLPGIRKLADQVGIPHWALKKRARELGLARTKEKPWSEAELAILARYAWMSDEHIRLKLKAAGYARTVTGIHLKLRRMRFKSDPSFYSGKGLVDALGIDSHVVTRWIKAGHLRAQLRGTKRTEQQGGDIYLIREKDVQRFILEHPSEIDLRKVDQLWFLDLITNGFVRSA
jgi:hypothetical protein